MALTKQDKTKILEKVRRDEHAEIRASIGSRVHVNRKHYNRTAKHRNMDIF